MSSAATASKPTFRQLGGWRGLIRNPGLVLHTWRAGRHAGSDAQGNQYYESRAGAPGRARRWVVYAGPPEASAIGPDWYGWLGFSTNAPLTDTGRRAWQKPHEPNLTGTLAGYRPSGHDYKGGQRQANSSDYEAWTPEASDNKATAEP